MKEQSLSNSFFIRCHTSEEIELERKKDGFKAFFLSGRNKGKSFLMSENQIKRLLDFNLAVIYDPEARPSVQKEHSPITEKVKGEAVTQPVLVEEKTDKSPVFNEKNKTDQTIIDDLIYW